MTPQEKRAHEYAKRASLCPGEFDVRFESYLQAEKDLALTWKDIRIISDLLVAVFNDYGIVSDKKIYTEILRRFNEQRNEK